MRPNLESVRDALARAAEVLEDALLRPPGRLSQSAVDIAVGEDIEVAKRQFALIIREARGLGEVLVTVDSPPLGLSATAPSNEGRPIQPEDDATLERTLARTEGVAVEIKAVGDGLVRLSLWYCTEAGRRVANYFTARAQLLFGADRLLVLPYGGQGYATISLQSVNDGAAGCDRWAIARGLLDYVTRRRVLWHFGADARGDAHRLGAPRGSLTWRPLAIGPEALLQRRGHAPPGYLVRSLRGPLKLGQVEWAVRHDSMAVLISGDNGDHAATSLARMSRHLAYGAATTSDLDPIWCAIVLERFALRVHTHEGGRFVVADFMPGRAAAAIELINALTRHPIGPP